MKTKVEIEAYERKACISWLKREASSLHTQLEMISETRPLARLAFAKAIVKLNEATSELEYGEHLKVPIEAED